MNLTSGSFLFSSSPVIQTNHAIFLFDNGDKNMIASMLRYGEKHDKGRLDQLDFRIIFMGPSLDAMTQEPFSHFPEKLLHFEQLGIKESIDRHWNRKKGLNLKDFNELCKNIDIKQKVWVGVSCEIFKQIIQYYQAHSTIEVVAIRDNPSPDGDTDYFVVAKDIQDIAEKIAVPSIVAAESFMNLNTKVEIIGHGPIDEWLEQAKEIDREMICNRLDLNPLLPIVVYAGVYGDYYKECFEMFLRIIPRKDVQLIVVPHPRYKGIIESKVCENIQNEFSQFKIVGEFSELPSNKVRTIEALSIADIVVTADFTSMIVFQSNSLGKRVLYVNPVMSNVAKNLCLNDVICYVTDKEKFLQVIEEIQLRKNKNTPSNLDIYKLLGIPKHGAQLLWNEFISTQH